MVRLATIHDLFDITLLAKKQKFDTTKTIDFTFFYSTWESIIKSGIGGIIIDEVDGNINAVLFYMVVPDMSDGQKILNEVFWHSFDSKSGIRVFNYFEELAKKLECKYIMVGAFRGEMMEKVQKFYEKKGYQLYNVFYMKEV